MADRITDQLAETLREFRCGRNAWRALAGRGSAQSDAQQRQQTPRFGLFVSMAASQQIGTSDCRLTRMHDTLPDDERMHRREQRFSDTHDVIARHDMPNGQWQLILVFIRRNRTAAAAQDVVQKGKMQMPAGLVRRVTAVPHIEVAAQLRSECANAP